MAKTLICGGSLGSRDNGNFAPGAAPPDKSNAREVVWGSGTPRVTAWASSKFYDIGFVKKE